MRIFDKRFGISTGFEGCQLCLSRAVHRLLMQKPKKTLEISGDRGLEVAWFTHSSI
jgi:hypothetical protein